MKALQRHRVRPQGRSEQERAVLDALRKFGQSGEMAYVAMMSARPQALDYGQTDSPAGLAVITSR
jgi:hypothetical protein